MLKTNKQTKHTKSKVIASYPKFARQKNRPERVAHQSQHMLRYPTKMQDIKKKVNAPQKSGGTNP